LRSQHGAGQAESLCRIDAVKCGWFMMLAVLVFTGLLVGILQSHLSRVRFLEDTLFTVLYATLIYMCVQYIQGLCQSRLGTADHALTHVAHVTTV
jgi:hypothetical protein